MTAGPTDDRLEVLARLIAGSPHNLVSRGERARVADVHIPECIAVDAALRPRDGERWMDLGTGGGLPGLVLAVLRPAVRWELVDATRKKIGAVARFADELRLDNVGVRWGRAEDLARDPDLRGRFDGVISRALADTALTARWSQPFLRPGGRAVLVKGPRVRAELAEPAMIALLDRLQLALVATRALDGVPRPTLVVELLKR